MSSLEDRLIAFLRKPKLGRWLALVAVLLSSPCLFIGFWLDDYIGRYVWSDLPGAHAWNRIIEGGYAIANGNPADNRWQVELGFAPWWIYDHLLVRLYRPISLATHLFDAKLWLHSAFMMHAHSLLWLALMVLAATRMYRAALGTMVGGFAALLFAVDHTHGFVVGYIANRHALVAGTLCMVCLELHMRAYKEGNRAFRVAAPVVYVLSLLSSEASLAVAGYLFAYALFVETGPLLRRALGFAPYFVATVVWRAAYNLTGHGARGSGLYLDPGRDPVHFILAMLERGPVLLLGQFFIPPAEAASLGGGAYVKPLLVFAGLFSVALVVAFAPLLAKSRTARFWALGLLVSLVPASSTWPHNRQLLFTSFGAMGLVAELWDMFVNLRGQKMPLPLRASGAVGAVLLLGRLVISPVATPIAVCSIALTTPLHHAITTVGDEIGGRDAVFVTAPDYFAVKLVQLSRRVEEQPIARRWRALSFGPEAVTVEATSARSLRLHYEGGILTHPFMELYRARNIPMPAGSRVDLAGLSIVVAHTTPDGRPDVADFTFDKPLTDPSFVFYSWTDHGFARFTPPAPGESTTLPPALMRYGLD
ncbi:MAG TPA: hypothetical protein VHC69_30010 [Polyangiaceae bacterium]|nr:hypothetical protein [Polyangiaceae bacterium]